MAAKSKLTENMTACLKVLAQRHPERIWRAAEFPYRSNHSMTALEKRGMVDHDMYAGYGITSAGAEAIGRADLFAEAQPATVTAQAAFDLGDKVLVAREGINSKSDEKFRAREVGTVLPSPDYKPGYTRVQFSDIVMVYLSPDELELWKPADKDEYTRLQQENADLIIERDTMDADRKRLREELDRLRKSNETLRRHLHDLAMLEGTEDVGEHRERITILREYE